MTSDNMTAGTGIETKMAQLEELDFPEEYFCGKGADGRINASADAEEEPYEPDIKFDIEDRRLGKLKKAAIWLEVELPELLLGAYFFLLREISEQPFIVVQTMLTDCGQVFPLRANLNQYPDLSELFRAVKRQCAQSFKPGLYPLALLKDITPRKVHHHRIVPFFCWDFHPEKAALEKAAFERLISSYYDLRFCFHRLPEARTPAGRVGCSCGFNRQRLRQDMVEKVIHAYLHVLDMVIEKMDSGGLLRQV
ncbi:MAG: hypothetical protein K6U80_13460 [Firmicutes bacterium]|nr:hypothetical protein [Bacillota bacterium]